MYLSVLKYKYNNRRTQVSHSLAPSRGFSSKILTRVWIGEFHCERLSTHRVFNSTVEDELCTEE